MQYHTLNKVIKNIRFNVLWILNHPYVLSIIAIRVGIILSLYRPVWKMRLTSLDFNDNFIITFKMLYKASIVNDIIYIKPKSTWYYLDSDNTQKSLKAIQLNLKKPESP